MNQGSYPLKPMSSEDSSDFIDLDALLGLQRGDGPLQRRGAAAAGEHDAAEARRHRRRLDDRIATMRPVTVTTPPASST